MITVDRICGTDLFSYETLDISLRDRGLVVIEGANGAGKTSIFDTLLWTLFGHSTKSLLADDVIREDQNHAPIKGNTRGYVCIFKGNPEGQDNDKIEVFRHRAHREYDNKLLLYVNGEDRTLGTDGKTQEVLDGYLGMDYDTFVSAVVFPQDGKGFVGLTDAQQKAIFDKIIDTERFVRAKEFNKKVLDTNKDTMARCSATLHEMQRNLENAVADERRINKEQDNWMAEVSQEVQLNRLALKALNDNQPVVDPDLEDRILEAQQHISQDRFLAIQKRARESSQDITDLKTKIAGYQAEHKFLIARAGARPTVAPPKPASYKGPEGVSAHIALLQAQITQSEAEVHVRQLDLVSIIDSIEKYDGTCPLCGAKADPVAEAKLIGESRKTQSDIEQSLIGLRKNIQNWKNELEKNVNFQKEIDLWVGYLAAVESYKQVDELEDTMASLQLAVSDAEEERSSIDLEYKALLDLRQEYDKLCATRDTQQKAVSEHTHKIAQAVAGLKEVENRVSPYLAQLEELRTRNKIAKKRVAQLESWQATVVKQVEAGLYWDRHFGNAGLKSLILAHLFPTLTERSNKYLSLLSDGCATIEFSSQTKLRTGEVREKIETKVELARGGGSYNKASGGEKQRVDLAVMFALGDLAAERTQSRINLRLLDEPFDNLDRDGAERVVRVLEELVVPQAGTVLVMSHSDYIKSLVQKRIEVIKPHGISYLIQN